MSNNPTAAQKRNMCVVVQMGCIACRLDGIYDTPAEFHHCGKHGNRDHDKGYPLCPGHHRPTAGITGIPNRHGNPKRFAIKYGTDDELFAMSEKLKGE